MKKLLILTATTGGGHDARADALAAWARELYGEGVEVKIFKPLEQEGKTPWGSFGVEFYNKIQRVAPFLHTLYFHVIEFIGDFQKRRYIGQKPYEAMLKEFSPDFVVSLHDFLNKGYFEAAQRILGDKVKTATYCGEYSGGEGFSRHWVAKTAMRWVGRTDSALLAARRLGYEGQTERFTFFLAPEELEWRSDSPEEVRRRLGLDERKTTVLLASGRNGAVRHLDYLKELLPLKNSLQVIVVCGLNEKMRQKVQAWSKENDFPMILEGYSSRMREFLEAADIVLMRGGANSATRAFYEGCPIWFDAMEGVLPQEKLTVEFFLRKGAAEVIHSPKLMAERLSWEIKNPERLAVMRSRMLALRELYLTPSPRGFFKEFLAWGLGQKALAEKQKSAPKALEALSIF